MPSRIQFSETAGGAFDRIEKSIESGLKETARVWHERFMPLHFTAEGGKAYGFKPRKGEGEPAYVQSPRGKVVAGGKSKYGQTRVVPNPKYYWAKYRRTGIKDPLVYTGESREKAQRSVRLEAKVVDGFASAAAIMNLPKHFYQRRLQDDPPDKVAELTRTLPAERAVLAGVLDASIAAHQRSANGAGSGKTVNVS